MKKNNVKKIMLYISLLPYAYVIIMSIYHAIFGYSWDSEFIETDYGVDGIVQFISNFWEDNFSFLFLLFLICISYQIYYFISLKTNFKGSTTKKKKINFKSILFYLSISCWVIYLLSGVHAFFFGTEVNEGALFYPEMVTYYGFDAMFRVMGFMGIIFTYIPVLPTSLLYIIIYSVKKIKNKREIS